MLFFIVCEIAPGATQTLKALRLRHLKFVEAHRGVIRIAGPSRDQSGAPTAMIMMVELPGLNDAENFIAGHPYVSSGRVFASVSVRQWSQVIPETEAGSLLRLIADEENAAS